MRLDIVSTTLKVCGLREGVLEHFEEGGGIISITVALEVVAR